MSILVTVDFIIPEMYNKIIEFYNTNKSPDDQPLERLDRCEGGFQIKILNKQNDNCDMNEKIKQLRWYKKVLVQHKLYKVFSEEETLLLYKSMKNVLGDNVSLVYE